MGKRICEDLVCQACGNRFKRYSTQGVDRKAEVQMYLLEDAILRDGILCRTCRRRYLEQACEAQLQRTGFSQVSIMGGKKAAKWAAQLRCNFIKEYVVFLEDACFENEDLEREFKHDFNEFVRKNRAKDYIQHKGKSLEDLMRDLYGYEIVSAPLGVNMVVGRSPVERGVVRGQRAHLDLDTGWW